MSCFVCSAKHYNSVKKAVVSAMRDTCIYSSMNAVYSLPFKKEDLINRIDEIFSDIIYLNVESYCLKYGVEDIEKTFESCFDKTPIKKIDLHGLYNALNCITYQIELDYITETRTLLHEEALALKFINDLKSEIAQEVIRVLPENETAWEIR